MIDLLKKRCRQLKTREARNWAFSGKLRLKILQVSRFGRVTSLSVRASGCLEASFFGRVRKWGIFRYKLANALYDGHLHIFWVRLPQENIFIDLLVLQVQNGGMVSGCLKPSGWKEVRQSFFTQVGLKFNPKSFSNKIQDLKSRYKEFRKLRFEQMGFGWDEEKHMVVSSPETWENYLLANPKAKRFRNMGCPEYNNLEIIFGGTKPTGRFSASLARGIESPPREDGHVPNDTHLEKVQQPSPGIADSANIDSDQISTTTIKQNARKKRPSEFFVAIS